MRTRITKTDQIFADTAPYSNDSQTNATRLLFVCSAGMLRSPTAANIGTALGFNTRACGSHGYALIPLSVNLINWADKIFFVNEENYFKALETFAGTGYEDDIKAKAKVWDIPDEFNWGDPSLKYIVNQLLEDNKNWT